MNKNFSGIKCLLTPFRNRAQVTPGVCHLFFYYLHHHQLRDTVSWCGQLVTISAVIRAGRKDKGASHKLLVAFPTPAKVVYHQIRRFFFPLDVTATLTAAFHMMTLKGHTNVFCS